MPESEAPFTHIDDIQNVQHVPKVKLSYASWLKTYDCSEHVLLNQGVRSSPWMCLMLYFYRHVFYLRRAI